jgi:hypothetical protein
MPKDAAIIDNCYCRDNGQQNVFRVQRAAFQQARPLISPDNRDEWQKDHAASSAVRYQAEAQPFDRTRASLQIAQGS